jgi:cephalosporin hydroxylase
MQYGSDLNAVQELLDGVTPETVIEAVLNSVECPL